MKRAPPAILNVWRFDKPLKYSGLRAASEVPRSASRNSTALWYPYRGQLYGWSQNSCAIYWRSKQSKATGVSWIVSITRFGME